MINSKFDARTTTMIAIVVDRALLRSDCPQIMHKFFTDSESIDCNKLFTQTYSENLPQWSDGNPHELTFKLSQLENCIYIDDFINHKINSNKENLGQPYFKNV